LHEWFSSSQEGELSQDLYTFHEAVSALQMLEEEVLDTHKLVMDNTTKFLNDAHSVFSATHEVDYDQEGKTNLFVFITFYVFFIGFPFVTALISYTMFVLDGAR